MVSAQLVKELRERTGAGMMDCKKALDATNGDMDKAIDWLRENGIAKAAKKGDRIAAEGLTKVVVDGNKAVILELNSETDFVAKNDQFLALIDTIANGLLSSDAKTLEEGLKVEIDGKTIEELVVNGTATIGEKLNLRRFTLVNKEDSQTFASYAHMGGTISVLLKLEGSNDEVSKQVAMHVAAANPQFLDQDSVDPQVVEKEKAMLTKEALDEGKPAEIVEKMIGGRIKKFFKEICLLDQDFVVDPDKTVSEVLKDNSLSLKEYVRYEVGEGIEKVETDFAQEVADQMK
ncbi:MAG: translation elongation factor Ts [Mycoplasmatales bacterium]